MFRAITVILALAVLLSPVASAQTGFAVISGLVRDASGAVIPGVAISATNVNTNVTRSVASTTEGYYTISNLIPGTYTLTAQFRGFKNLERSGIVLRVGDNVSIDLPMEVGAAAEQVTVTGEAPLLRTEDAQSGQVIDNRRIQELPQYNRNPLAFALLTANVNGTSDQQGRTSDFRINGGRGAQAEYFIDGLPVTTGYQHDVAASVPSMEAVSEFNVMTNGLSAEFGRLSGGAVVLVTRSGTNQFHGSVYEYFRNDKLNANDWNSNRYGQRIGVFHDNVFGGALGGPMWIPKIYDGHNKTFFFLNYEGTRHVSGTNASTAGVPTLLERQGDFSQSLIDNGKPVQVFDPLTGQVAGGDVVRQPFPGNRVPKERFNALSEIYLKYYPLPNNAPLSGSSHDANYLGASRTPSSDDRWTGRLDQNWNSSHVTHFTLTRDDSKSSSDRWLSALQPASISWGTTYTPAIIHSWMLSPTTMVELRGGLVRVAANSGTMVDVNSSGWPVQDLVTGLLGTTQGRAPSLATNDTITTLGGGGANNFFETNYTGSINVQRLNGKHTLKFGYEHRRYYANVFSAYGGNVGTFSESTLRSVTSQSYNSPPPTGSGFASWLLGITTTGSGSQYAGAASLQPYHGAFLTDTFRVNPRLTLNYGVRWEFEPPRTERYDRQYFWDEKYVWPWKPADGWSFGQIAQSVGLNPSSIPTPIWTTKGVVGRAALIGTSDYPGRTSTKVLPAHFAPRFGVAYEFLPHTVVRGTYGINWMTTTGSRFLNGANRNIGYGAAARYNTPGNGLTYPLTFDNPMPGGAGYVPYSRDITFLNMRTMGTWFDVPSYDFRPGYEHTIGLGIQRQVGSGANAWVLEVNYNSSLARGLPFYLGFGEHILPGAYDKLVGMGNALNAQVPNPFYGQVPAGTGMGGKTIAFGRLFQLNPLWLEIWTAGGPYGNSEAPSVWGVGNYHSIYLQAEHRFGRGFSLMTNFILSKLLQDTGGIDNALPQGQGEQFQPQAGSSIGEVYGRAPSDISKKFLVNYSLELPFGRGRRLLANAPLALDTVVGGWVLAGTAQFRSGQPISVFTPSGAVGGLGSQWYNIGHGRNNRPVMVGNNLGSTTNGHAALLGAPNFQYYMNPNAFRLTQGWELGDVPSTFGNWEGPGFSQWDMSLMKNVGLGAESRRLTFRLEAQNIFNHMNCGQPDGGVTRTTFGLINSQAGTPRRAMISVKLSF